MTAPAGGRAIGSTLRRASIPFDHVIAETVAFPLASEAALAGNVGALHPLLPDGASRRFWREAERHIQGCFPGFTVDEIVAVRDRVWFGHAGAQPIALHGYLRGIASWFLESRGAIAVPRLPPAQRARGAVADAEAVLARRGWRWLSFALPSDLLLAALWTGRAGPSAVELVSPNIDQSLRDQGFAETHLHLGAALDFPLLWTVLQYRLGDPALRRDLFMAPGAALDEGRDFAPWLVRAAMIRYVLGSFLAGRLAGESLPAFAARLFARRLSTSTSALVARASADLRAGRLSTHVPFAAWVGAYGDLTRVRAGGRLPDDLGDIIAIDPLHRGFGGGLGDTPELRWLARSLAFLQGAEGDGAPVRGEYARLFWQVVRVRNLFFRHVTQRPLTPGLTWFVRFYERMSVARRDLNVRARLQAAAHVSGAGRGLVSLEVRTGPPATTSAAVRELNDFDDAVRALVASPRAASDPPRELGIVFHFIKDRGDGSSRGHPEAHWVRTHADPSWNGGGPRYRRYFLGQQRLAQNLVWLFDNFPSALRLVRAVDVCTDEIGVPTWVLAPLVKQVRRAADRAGRRLAHLSGDRVLTLRTTAHAGEDFIHLLTGLRGVDQAIDHLPLSEGDRLGHGVALGIHAGEWSRRAGRLAVALEERLLDLVWEWSCYARKAVSAPGGRQSAIEHEIDEHSRTIFAGVGRAPPTAFELASLLDDLGQYDLLRIAGFPDGELMTGLADDRTRLLHDYLANPLVFRHGRQVTWIEPEREAEAIEALQSALRSKVGARSITVEVNPTSNLLIGDMGDLTHHPLWRLHPPIPLADAPPVSISVGSDDPIVFASNLREEYQWLCDALSLAGQSSEQARVWIDGVRRAGLDARFTVPYTAGARVRTEPV